jgi:hypothetical protein
MRSTFRPAPGSFSEKMASQNNYDTVKDGNGHQDFSHIVEECRCQQVWCGLPRSFQALE